MIVERLSDAPRSQTTVIGINAGPDIRQRVGDADHADTYQQITGKVYDVDVR